METIGTASAPLQDKRVQKTKGTIRCALFELMAAKPFEKITIKELAAKAEIDRKTFYMHYKKLTDLLLELEGELIAKLRKGVLRPTFAGGMLQAAHMLRSFSVVFQENGELFDKLVQAGCLGSIFSQMDSMICENILAAAREEERANTPMLARAAKFVSSGITTMYMNWVREGRRIPVETLADEVSVLAFGSLNTALYLPGRLI